MIHSRKNRYWKNCRQRKPLLDYFLPSVDLIDYLIIILNTVWKRWEMREVQFVLEVLLWMLKYFYSYVPIHGWAASEVGRRFFTWYLVRSSIRWQIMNEIGNQYLCKCELWK